MLWLIDFFTGLMVDVLVNFHNFRYQTDYENNRNSMLFIFQLINTTMPLAFIGYVKSNFYGLFTQLFITLVVEAFVSFGLLRSIFRWTFNCCLQDKKR